MLLKGTNTLPVSKNRCLVEDYSFGIKTLLIFESNLNYMQQFHTLRLFIFLYHTLWHLLIFPPV